MTQDRLQKVLARAGVASRRHAENLIVGGRVRVNGHVVTELGTKADPKRDKVEVDGRRVVAEEFVYIVLHKPRGVVATMSDPEGRLSVKKYLEDAPGRVYPVGRLDYATSGVLLATNDGDFAEGLLHPRGEVPRTYVVKVKGQMKERDLTTWSQGVSLDDGMTRPATATLLRHEDDKTWFELTIKEGRNQQIRRMGEATGFPVMRLARTVFAGISSEGLRPGTWRLLTSTELTMLKKAYGVPRKTFVQPGRPRPSGGAHPGGRAPARTDRSGAARRTERDTVPSEGPRATLGRGGAQSRTTGTGGGIGASDEGAGYRLSRRRGRSR